MVRDYRIPEKIIRKCHIQIFFLLFSFLYVFFAQEYLITKISWGAIDSLQIVYTFLTFLKHTSHNRKYPDSTGSISEHLVPLSKFFQAFIIFILQKYLNSCEQMLSND